MFDESGKQEIFMSKLVKIKSNMMGLVNEKVVNKEDKK